MRGNSVLPRESLSPDSPFSPRERSQRLGINCKMSFSFGWTPKPRRVDRKVPYLGFGSISGIVHLIARLRSVMRAVVIVVTVVVLCWWDLWLAAGGPRNSGDVRFKGWVR